MYRSVPRVVIIAQIANLTGDAYLLMARHYVIHQGVLLDQVHPGFYPSSSDALNVSELVGGLTLQLLSQRVDRLGSPCYGGNLAFQESMKFELL